MAYFNCKVIDQFGKTQEVIRRADDKAFLSSLLKKEGYYLVDAKIEQEKAPNVFLSVSSKPKFNEVISFFRQFSVMIKAGVSISDCLNSLKEQNYTKAFQKVLLEVYNDIQSGVLLSAAFAKHPKVFPKFFTNMVAIGEVSGSLENVLDSMASYYENDRKVKRKVKSSLAYPIFLIVIIVAVVTYLMVSVVPSFKDMIEELGGEVPKITLIVLAISNFFVNYWVIMLSVIVGIVLLVMIAIRTKKGKYAVDFLKAKFPLIKNINQAIVTSRFAKAFVILLDSGMNMVDCLNNLQKMIGNALYEEKFKYTIEEVKRGKRIAISLANTKLFPPMLVEMVNVGEKSGNIQEVLKSTADFFDETVESTISKTVAVIEPLMICILGVVVAFVILSVLIPMMALMSSI